MKIKCTCGHEFDHHSAAPLRHRLVVGDSTKGDEMSVNYVAVSLDRFRRLGCQIEVVL